MAKVLVDIYKAKDMYSGLGQFSWQFAQALRAQEPKGLDLDFLISPGAPKIADGAHIKSIPANFLKRYLPSLNPSYDLWHSLQQFPSHLPPKGAKWVLTIHDLNFLKEKDAPKARRYLARLQAHVDRAHTITTISKFAQRDILAHLDLKGKTVHVIHNGVAPGAEPASEHPSFLPKGKFFFSIGIFNEKKNFKVLLPLLQKFPTHRLVIAGRSDTSYGKDIAAEAERLGLAGRLILPGKVSEQDKAWLYQHCDAFFFPSLAEGFGMPAIEAMGAGAPVFLSKATSLPEIGGKAAFYFDDFSPETMAGFVAQKLAEIAPNRNVFSEGLKKHASNFTWDACINQYIALYRKVLG